MQSHLRLHWTTTARESLWLLPTSSVQTAPTRSSIIRTSLHLVKMLEYFSLQPYRYQPLKPNCYLVTTLAASHMKCWMFKSALSTKFPTHQHRKKMSLKKCPSMEWRSFRKFHPQATSWWEVNKKPLHRLHKWPSLAGKKHNLIAI